MKWNGTDPIGPNTDYPLSLTDRGCCKYYWRPHRLAITKARLVAEFGEFELGVPILMEGIRAMQAYHLLRPTGMTVLGVATIPTEFNQYAVTVWFFGFAEAIRVPPNGYYWKVDAGMQAIPLVTNKLAIASTRVFPEDLAGAAGYCRLLFTGGEGTTIPLYHRTDGVFPWANQVFVEMEMDYVPWPFLD